MKAHFAFSVQGESHKRRENEEENLAVGKKFPCQDKSCAEELFSEGKIKFDFLCVSDGHGGDAYFRSAKGAEFAIQVFKDILIRNMKRISELAFQNEGEKIKNQLALSVSKRWREKIKSDLAQNPVTELEISYLEKVNPKAAESYKNGKDLIQIYGCTLVGYFSTEKFWFALQIGDGDFGVSYDGKKFEFPVPEDENCFLNQTTSLCDAESAKEFRFYLGEKTPLAVFCSSDGAANSFKTKNQFENFYKSVYDLFNKAEFPKCQNLGCENQKECGFTCRENLAEEEIKNYLPVLSKKGSGDDISLAGFVFLDENKAQSVQNYYRAAKLLKTKSLGDTKKAKNILFDAAKNKNIKAIFKLGEIISEEAENEAKISVKVRKLSQAKTFFEMTEKCGIEQSKEKIIEIQEKIEKIDAEHQNLESEHKNLDRKITSQIKDFINPLKTGIDKKIEKLEANVSSFLQNHKEEAQK